MLEKLKDRYNQVILFFAVFIIILFIRIFTLTIVEGEKYQEMADNIRIKKIPITAPRGEIRDRYGRLLAGNKPSFTVQIMKNELIDEQTNEIAIKLLNILEKNGEKSIDNFPIVLENGKYIFTYDNEIEDWLEEQGIYETKDAQEVFNILRERLEIDPKADVFEAQAEMQQYHGIFPPISVKTMKFLQEMQKENFLQKYNLDTTLTAEESFIALKKRFNIPDTYNYGDARKILILRHELREQGYRQYQPVKIALNVSNNTVAAIEEMNMELPGVNVEMEPIRHYPYDFLASHVIGYLSKISDNEKEKFINELNYKPSDLIGKDGIEKVYEQNLKGKDGAKYVEVDVYGRLINVLREENPVKGENVYLTIDAELQKIAEDALEYALKQIQVGGTFESQWGNYKYSKVYKNATSGAVVALDAKTGEVLALANYPSFNPNLFSTGISSVDWKALQDQNPRDPISPLPLYNIATRAAIQPGSTFKMITGLAAIEQGLSPTHKMYDNGFIQLGSRSFGCWLWNRSKAKHGWVDLYRALEVSCNYYFYNVATGWDHYKNQPLPGGMNVNKLLDYTRMFGLGEATGIEISEAAYGAPNPQKKTASIKAMLRRHINANAKEYFTPEVIADRALLEKQIETIVNWAEENPGRGELINRVSQLGVKKEKVETLADTAKFSYFNQAKWTKGDTFNLSIGQGEHAYTPLQMANYIAAISNGGYKNKVSVVKKVGNDFSFEEDFQNEENRIPLKDYNNLNHIKRGMADAAQGEEGTSRSVFAKFPLEVTAKTGTAQRAGKIQPKDEGEYLRKYLRWIAPGLKIEQVEAKAKEIMRENRDQYKDLGLAMRQAIKELTNNRVTDAKMDEFKDNYDNFAWFVSFAPYDDPQIVVVSMIFQGGSGGYAAPIAREIMAEYFGLNNTGEKINLKNTLTQ
ncbi:penicillin-binding transpeptidase domain-containing protein [Geosporobacter ferrireducens]|uniref:Penicillin-binding protein n=1 Tax=Geosporobacter ferrireducens TaxID=1424294 RepID=A0A1D8GPP7_9FIRM|nr:penicillin-binding transpeptidase domain-containing protein [Geosporobacter ferrireducens]AOT72754.1 hypothetical protein Gferi_26280 [Geosporobacter ferrireducens]MTI55169.1 penicillin-binding protein [Geosporobacter ferrireducens]